MASYRDIRLGVQTVLQAQIPDLRVYAHEPEGVLEYPCVVVGQVQAFNYLPILQAGGFKGSIALMVYVHSTSPEEAQDALEAFYWPAGVNSLFRAINTDSTLNGSVNHALITGLIEDATRDRDSQGRHDEWSAVVNLEITHAVS